MRIDTIRDFWFTDDVSKEEEVFTYVVGAKSLFLEDCRDAVQGRVANTEATISLLGALAVEPSNTTKSNLIAYLDCDDSEADRLYNMVRGVLTCMLIAQSLKRKDCVAVGDRLLPAALRCWGIDIKPMSIGAELTHDALRVANAVFGDLSKDRERDEEKNRIGEIWDLVQFLLGGQPCSCAGSSFMRVMAVSKDQGFCPVLTLELIEQGHGFRRHPTSLLLSCDELFRNSFNIVQTFAKDKGFVWNNSLRVWTTGAVRWRLHVLSDRKRLTSVSGASAGGAIGIGMILLLTGEASDNVVITAQIDSDGRLWPVDNDSIEPKIDAAINAQLYSVIVESSQAPDFDKVLKARYVGQPFELLPFDNVVDAAGDIARRSGPRGIHLAEVSEKTGRMEVLSGRVDIAGGSGLYIPMPLLREVRREKLIESDSIGLSHSSDDDSGGFDGRHWRTILRWEESIFQEHIDHEEVPLDDVFQSARRFVVIGPPGSGKSTLAQYLAWRTSASVGRLDVCDKLVVPVLVRLVEWETANRAGSVDFPTFLASKFKPGLMQWQQWLECGEVLLLLDGLDEVEPAFVGLIRETVDKYKQCLLVLTCRSISRERLEKALDKAPVFTPSPFNIEQQKQYIDRYPRLNKGFDPDRLAVEVQRPEIQMFASNPLLLSIICFVADATGNSSLPTTRARLYEQAISTVLSQFMEGSTSRVAIQYPFPQTLVTRREALENLALEMFADSSRQLIFTEEATVRALRAALKSNDSVTTMADALLFDLRENSRIFAGNPKTGYYFIHPTIQEYLAACALARRAADVGFDGRNRSETGGIARWERNHDECGARWQQAFITIDAAFKEEDYNRAEAEIRLADPLLAFMALLDHKAWLPEWQEVYLFIAGRLNDPAPLLDLLSDRYVKRDDAFRHRLALAAMCMAQIDPTVRNEVKGSTQRLST